jgi:hypothetical protein
MKGAPFSLSSKGLLNLPPISYPDAFQFIVGRRTYPCSFVLADFLSGAVAKLHSIDPMADCFRVEVPDRQGLFGTFLSLGKGAEIRVNPENLKTFTSFAKALENDEFLAFLLGQISLELNNDTVIERLEQKLALRLDASKESGFAPNTSLTCENGFLN